MRTVTTPFADQRLQHLAEWTASMLDASEATATKIGCSAAAIVAQAALETGWGASAIGNNVFGIKVGSGWTGMRQLRSTWEHLNGEDVPMMDWFRDYSTLADGIDDHFNFLTVNTRYADVFDRNNSISDEEYLSRLARDGYATDPNYANNLVGVLNTVRMLERHMTDDGRPLSDVAKPASRLLLIGSHGGDVMDVQKVLAQRGFYHNSIDGDFGPRTRSAVMAFQSNVGLLADGIIGKDTHAALGV